MVKTSSHIVVKRAEDRRSFVSGDTLHLILFPTKRGIDYVSFSFGSLPGGEIERAHTYYHLDTKRPHWLKHEIMRSQITMEKPCDENLRMLLEWLYHKTSAQLIWLTAHSSSDHYELDITFRETIDKPSPFATSLLNQIRHRIRLLME